jgi:hypothetical protein
VDAFSAFPSTLYGELTSTKNKTVKPKVGLMQHPVDVRGYCSMSLARFVDYKSKETASSEWSILGPGPSLMTENSSTMIPDPSIASIINHHPYIHRVPWSARSTIPGVTVSKILRSANENKRYRSIDNSRPRRGSREETEPAEE